MLNIVQAYSNSEDKKKLFETELKIYVNEKLYQKKRISEDMYHTAKEILLKNAV